MNPANLACCSGDIEARTPRFFLCLRCRCQVVMCRRCDRGQVYCGSDCSGAARREKQREARRRYQATERGRRLHADCSRRYRLKNHSVTDQGCSVLAKASPKAMVSSLVTRPIAPNVCETCFGCGKRVSARFRLSPVRRKTPRAIRQATLPAIVRTG